MTEFLKPIALTMGEPSGISAEISLKVWLNRRHKLQPFFLIDDPNRLMRVRDFFNLDVKIAPIDKPDEAIKCFKKFLPVLSIKKPVDAILSRPDIAFSQAVVDSISEAVALVLSKKVSAIVTNPIVKSVLYKENFPFPGHTEFLAHLAETTETPVMMLASEKLKVVPVTRHVGLVDAATKINSDLIVKTAATTRKFLIKYFNIKEPSLAVSGLNPHAGEDGFIGKEEKIVIEPAIAQLQSLGYNVTGPHSADSMFHEKARKSYDAALCMYHDQALIPIKTLDFFGAVNLTLGLPFVRTSPDHGAGTKIADAGIADETSLFEAIKLASVIAVNASKT